MLTLLPSLPLLSLWACLLASAANASPQIFAPGGAGAAGGGGGSGGSPGLKMNFRPDSSNDILLYINNVRFAQPAGKHMLFLELEKAGLESIVYSARIASAPAAYGCFFWNMPARSAAAAAEFEARLDALTIPAARAIEHRNTFVSKTFYLGGPGLGIQDAFLNAELLNCFRVEAEDGEKGLVRDVSHLWIVDSYKRGLHVTMFFDGEDGSDSQDFRQPLDMLRGAVVHGAGPGSKCLVYYGGIGQSRRSVILSADEPVSQPLKAVSRIQCFKGDIPADLLIKNT